MKIHVVYCHPDKNSFTHAVKESFVRGLADGGHTYVISDLYDMKFNPVFSESEYKREAFYLTEPPVPSDVIDEQYKINNADAIVFIYPVFWTECPALLTGWFQRVWTYGFAYGERTMKKLKKALFLVTMGGNKSDPIRQEQIKAMQTVMLGDRISDRAEECEFIVFDRMTRDYDKREKMFEKFTTQAYNAGRNF